MPSGRISHPANSTISRCRSPGGGVLSHQENHTMDIAVLAIGAIFFALAFAYVAVCEKL